MARRRAAASPATMPACASPALAAALGGLVLGAVVRPRPTVAAAAARATTVWAVGDAENSARARALAALVRRERPDRLLYLGDVYETRDARASSGSGYDAALRLARAPHDPDAGQPRVGQPRRRVPAVLASEARPADARLAPPHASRRLAGAVPEQRGAARPGLAAGPLARARRAPARHVPHRDLAPAALEQRLARRPGRHGAALERRCAATPASSSPATTTTCSASPTATGCARSSPAAAGGRTSRCRAPSRGTLRFVNRHDGGRRAPAADPRPRDDRDGRRERPRARPQRRDLPAGQLSVSRRGSRRPRRAAAPRRCRGSSPAARARPRRRGTSRSTRSSATRRAPSSSRARRRALGDRLGRRRGLAARAAAARCSCRSWTAARARATSPRSRGRAAAHALLERASSRSSASRRSSASARLSSGELLIGAAAYASRAPPCSTTTSPSRTSAVERRAQPRSGAIAVRQPVPGGERRDDRPRTQRVESSKRSRAPRGARAAAHDRGRARRTSARPGRPRSAPPAPADRRAELHHRLVPVVRPGPGGSSASGEPRPSRAATRRTFVSTAATCSPNANEPTAAAVYGPDAGQRRAGRPRPRPAVAGDDPARLVQPHGAACCSRGRPRRPGRRRARAPPARRRVGQRSSHAS